MNDKQKLSFARKWRHYFEGLIYVECLAHGIKKTPVLEIEGDGTCFQRPGLIHIGTKCCEAKTKEELFSEFLFFKGHEMQHMLSTTHKDWMAAQKLCFNTALQRLSVKAFGKTRRLSKDSDYEAFFIDLASKGIFLNQEQLKFFIHLLLNTVEDGRIENIRSQNHPGFAFYRKTVYGRVWHTMDLYAIDGNKDLKDLEDTDKFRIVMYQLLFLSLLGIYQKGFLDRFGGTELHKYVKSLIPYISGAVLGKTCKDAMDNGRIIFEKLLDWLLELCTLELSAKELEKLFKDMLQMLMDESENSEYSATPSSEEKGSGLPADSLFGQTELEMEVSEEEYQEMMENADEGDMESPAVKIKVKDEKEGDDAKESQDTEEGSAESEGDKGEESKADSGSSKETSGESEDSESDSSDSTAAGTESEESSEDSDDESESEQNGQKDTGHNAYGEEGSDEDPDSLEEKIQKEMEGAAEQAKGDFELAEADAALDEKFREAASKYSAVEPEDVDLSGVDSHYDEDIDFTESVRVYDPTGRLPLELENKGKSLNNKVNELVKNKQDPDQRYLKSGMLDTRRLTNLATGDLSVFKKKGEPNKTDVAAFLLMDNSGSMGDGPGSTRFACCNAVAVLEEGFKRHMPLKIAAFDASGTHYVHHEVIKEFDEVIEPNLAYNFRDLGRSGGGNKDGYSIRVATRQLMARPEKDGWTCVRAAPSR